MALSEDAKSIVASNLANAHVQLVLARESTPKDISRDEILGIVSKSYRRYLSALADGTISHDPPED